MLGEIPHCAHRGRFFSCLRATIVAYGRQFLDPPPTAREPADHCYARSNDYMVVSDCQPGTRKRLGSALRSGLEPSWLEPTQTALGKAHSPGRRIVVGTALHPHSAEARGRGVVGRNGVPSKACVHKAHSRTATCMLHAWHGPACWKTTPPAGDPGQGWTRSLRPLGAPAGGLVHSPPDYYRQPRGAGAGPQPRPAISPPRTEGRRTSSSWPPVVVVV